MKNALLLILFALLNVSTSFSQEAINKNGTLSNSRTSIQSVLPENLFKLQLLPLWKFSRDDNNPIPDSIYNYIFETENDSLLLTKTYTEFNAEKNIITNIFHEKNPLNNQWNPVTKYENIASGTDTYNTFYLWDIQHKTWVCQNLFERRFDSQGNEILYKSYNIKNWNGYEEGYLQENSYDSNGNKTSSSFTYWNAEKKDWIKDRKEEFEFDSINRLTLKIESIWDNSINNWRVQRKEKTEYQINALGIAESSLSEVWNEEKQLWMKYSKQVYAYNETSGYLTFNSISLWNNSSNTYDLISRNEFSHDEKGHVILDISYNWDNRKKLWIPSYKFEYQFDNEENRTLYAMYNWDYIINDWNGAIKNEQQFNSNKMVTKSTVYSWNTNTKNWVNASKNEVTYNNFDKVTLSLQFIWEATNNSWIPNTKFENSFDDFQNNTLSESYSWNTVNSQWQITNSNKTEYTYNTEGYILIASNYTWDFTLNSYHLNFKDYYFYKSPNNATFNAYSNNQVMKVFPNPANNFITITGAPITQLLLYSNDGKCCLQTNYTQNHIDISNLKSGIYILNAISKTGTYSTKIIKE